MTEQTGTVSQKAQRELWAVQHRDAMARLGLQAVFCKTRNHEGKLSPVPMEGVTGSAPFGVFVMAAKGYTRPAFRVPHNAICLDVDQKPGKTDDGALTLARAEVDLGFLPPTQRLTAHGFGQGSGRMLFRIPEGMLVDEQFFKQYGGAVDVVRTGHRYSMAPGDIHHSTGTPVVCYGPGGSEQEMLPVDQWPMLPEDWLQAMTEWSASRGTFEVGEPGERSLESVMSHKAAQATVISQLDKIATHDTTESGFRAKLMTASLTIGGFVGSMYADADEAAEALFEAVTTAWGAEPDRDDVQIIGSGVAKGMAAPWVVTAPEPEPVAAPAAKIPPVVLTDVLQATEWLRDEIGRRGMSGLFLRTGRLVKVVETPLKLRESKSGVVQHDGFQQIASIDVAGQLRAYAQMCGYRFFTPGGKDTPPKPILLNTTAAAVCIDTPEDLPYARTLRGVTGTPIIRTDGTILDTPGYDDHSQLLYKADDPELVVPWVPESPTADQVTAARELLEYIVIDYRFVSDDHRANYLGALMLPLLRALVPPPYKLLAVDAHAPGSGKTLLADVLRIIHHGRPGGTPGGSFRSEWPKKEEFSKWVSSVLMNGAGGVVQVDNVKSTLAGGELEGLLTNASYGGRVLGRSEEVRVPNDRLWVVTGNNISIGGDMARRVLWARIDPDVENPEQRSPDSFHEPQLEQWVSRNRGRIIHAVLTLARAWYVAGAELAPATSSDSYATAIGVVQGILKHAGITGTFDPVSDRERSSDEYDTADFLRMVYEWQEERGEKGYWLSSDLSVVINSDFGDLREAIPEHWWRGESISTRSLGKQLDKLKGAYHNGLKLAAGPLSHQAKTWRVVSSK